MYTSNSFKTCCVLLFIIGFSTLAESVSAQGVLLDETQRFRLPRHRRVVRPQPISYRISSIDVNSEIDGQVAVTQVSQTFVNTGNRQIEASFVFPLPYDGAVDRMTFLVDGKEYEAKLLKADKAREIYEGYVRRNQDPALLEWMGQGMFKTSVFPIPAGASRTVQIRYTQLLRKDSGVVDYLLPMATARFTDSAIDKFSIRSTIKSKQKLKNIYSPTHDVQIDRSGDNLAIVKFSREKFIPGTDIRLLYSTDDKSIGANLISHWPNDAENGYFTLMVSPEIKKAAAKPTRKSVIFVVDQSGSMNGKKIEQAREAAKFVLNNLQDNDLFNIVTYSTDVKTFEPEMQAYSGQTRQAALGFIESIYAGGSTNIDGALAKTFSMIKDNSLPTYVVFMTDGLPTKGETNAAKIANNARRLNQHNARLISFGVGYDVNSRLLDLLTRENNGLSQYVRPDENLEEHVSNLYSKIAAPVLTDVKLEYRLNGQTETALVNRVYPGGKVDLFAGQQLVLVGRYRKGGTGKLTMTGKVGDEERKYEYDVTFNEKSAEERYSFTARIWAARRIGEIIDVIDLEGKNTELIDELIRLSTKHGIVTQYTSYLADDLAPASRMSNLQFQRDRTEAELNQLAQQSGQSGFAQRRNKQMLKERSRQGPAMGGDGAVPADQGGNFRGLHSQAYGPSAGVDADSARAGRGRGGGGFGGGGKVAQKKSTIRSVDKYTAYLKGNILIASNASDVDMEKDKATITEIKRYSDEYFALIKTTSKEENQLLTLQADDEQMLVRLQGKVYLLK